MTNIADIAAQFAAKTRAGAKPSVSVNEEHAVLLLQALVREGIQFASDCLDNIRDERLRAIIAAFIFGTAGGAVVGLAIGTAVGGPAGAPIGAAVGAGVGFVAACVAVAVVTLSESPDGRLVVACT